MFEGGEQLRAALVGASFLNCDLVDVSHCSLQVYVTELPKEAGVGGRTQIAFHKS